VSSALPTLECFGTGQSIATAAAIARPGSTIGIVGVPHGQVPFAEAFFRNIGWRGGPAPGPDLNSRTARRRPRRHEQPPPVLDYETDLDHIADAYRATDERRAIKPLVRVGAV
jgi:threonine dehydrogenase-like Zn-dependent dehydrogenase